MKTEFSIKGGIAGCGIWVFEMQSRSGIWNVVSLRVWGFPIGRCLPYGSTKFLNITSTRASLADEPEVNVPAIVPVLLRCT